MTKAWLGYAGVALGLVVVVALIVGALVDQASAVAVWVGAAAACLVQVAAFAILLTARGRPGQFLVAWGGGSLLRFLLIGLLAVWATRVGALPAEPLLLSAVGCVTLLALLEPVFLHRGTSRI